MGMKQDILKNAYLITEMAAKELAQVVNLIKQGKLKEAAFKYIDVGGNPSSSGVSKTVNSHITKNPDLTPEEKQYFEGFKTAVETARMQKDIKSNRPDTYKTGTTGSTKTGETVVVKGLNASARKENVLKIIDKQKIEIDKERAMLDAGTDENGLRNMAHEFVKDMKDAPNMTAEDEMFIATLRTFYDKGIDKEKAIDIMHTIIDEGEKVMMALKKRVAAGGMVKPSEKTIEQLGSRYRDIDKLKAGKTKALEAKPNKAIEVKEETLNENVNITAIAIFLAILFTIPNAIFLINRAKDWFSKKFGKQFTEAKLQEIAKKYKAYGFKLIKQEDIRKAMEAVKVKPSPANFNRLYQIIAKIRTPKEGEENDI